jgi:hypothetical protein
MKTVWMPLADSGCMGECVVFMAGFAMAAGRWLYRKLYTGKLCCPVFYFPVPLPAYEIYRKE